MTDVTRLTSPLQFREAIGYTRSVRAFAFFAACAPIQDNHIPMPSGRLRTLGLTLAVGPAEPLIANRLVIQVSHFFKVLKHFVDRIRDRIGI